MVWPNCSSDLDHLEHLQLPPPLPSSNIEPVLLNIIYYLRPVSHSLRDRHHHYINQIISSQSVKRLQNLARSCGFVVQAASTIGNVLDEFKLFVLPQTCCIRQSML